MAKPIVPPHLVLHDVWPVAVAALFKRPVGCVHAYFNRLNRPCRVCGGAVIHYLKHSTHVFVDAVDEVIKWHDHVKMPPPR